MCLSGNSFGDMYDTHHTVEFVTCLLYIDDCVAASFTFGVECRKAVLVLDKFRIYLNSNIAEFLRNAWVVFRP